MASPQQAHTPGFVGTPIASPQQAQTPGFQLLDSRGITKPANFSGKREDFEEWVFPFESYTAMLGWERFIAATAKAPAAITQDMIPEEARGIDSSLYHLLVSLCRGIALSIIKLVPRGHGFEALRMLYKDYRPDLNEDHGVLLQHILNPVWWKERSGLFTDTLIEWDNLIARYETATGEKVTENMRTSTVLAHAPDEIKTLLRSASRETRCNSQAMRTCIWEAVLGGANSSVSLPRSGDAMEVDAIAAKGGKKGGKQWFPPCKHCGRTNHSSANCFSKDRPGKGDKRGKGGKKGDKQPKATKAFAGKCNYCQKTGHKQAECRKKIADEKAGNGAGGANAITQEDENCAIEVEYEDSDEDFYCMALEDEHSVEAVEGQYGTFVTLDTASDGHCGPPSFAKGCRMVQDEGPRLMDAQQKVIPMEGAAVVPMAALALEGKPQLLKAKVRVGETLRKPILSLLSVMDGNTDFWLSKQGMLMYPGGDLTNPIPLTRRNNTLGMMTETFSSSQEARNFVHSVNANEADPPAEPSVIPGSSGSGGAQPQVEPIGAEAPDVAEVAQPSHPGMVLHPDSRVEDMRRRLRELGQPVGGRKDDIWSRLSRAEAKLKEHNDKMELLRLRHEQAVENGPTVEPRTLPGPREPTAEEREAHNLLHMVPADWCEACVRGVATANPHKKLTYDKKDIGKARVFMDFAYIKTDGNWVDPFQPGQRQRSSLRHWCSWTLTL